MTPVPAAQDAPDLSAFAWKLFAEIARAEGNACVSPWSVAVALGMARAGAAGDTARQLDAALGIADDAVAKLARLAQAPAPRHGETAEYELLTANAAWLSTKCQLLPDYTRVLEHDFTAPPQRIDFASPRARTTINSWVLDQTKERIRDLLPPGKPDAEARLVLVNCLFLKAAWAMQFDASRTQARPFHLAGGKAVDVPTMRKTKRFGYATAKQAHVVELPFAGRDLVMLLVVPKPGVTLADARAEFAGAQAALPLRTDCDVALELPRFKFEAATTLNAALHTLGVHDALDPQRADFSAMTPPDDPVFISAVLHKTFVKVDENGTEAAAATAVEMAPTSAMPQQPQEPIVVRADRPFLFVIQHARAGALFVGRVSDPR
jgi:serpin B